MLFTKKNGTEISWNDVSYAFYRGGAFQFNFKLKSNGEQEIIFKKHLHLDYNGLTSFFYREVSKKCLGNLLISHAPISKLSQLALAKECGMYIPETFVSSNLDWIRMQTKNETLVTKAVQETIFTATKDSFLELKSQIVNVDKLHGLYAPSLFQTNGDKKIEIRTFVMNNKFYSLGMHVPKELSHSVDIRNNIDNTRFFKYELPKELKCKMLEFMNQLNLNTGSFDFLLDQNGKFIFLEINPTGQYDWVSVYGFYNIEKEIAMYLKNKNDEYTQ